MADDTANDGELTLTIPAIRSFPPATTRSAYCERTARSTPAMSPFYHREPPVTVFTSTMRHGRTRPGDWTTASGNDCDQGRVSATPKASMPWPPAQRKTNSSPGDVIRVDVGTYNLLTNIVLSPAPGLRRHH